MIPTGERGVCDRVPVQMLAPDRNLSELFRTKATVVMLDSYAALAPRKLMGEEGLSDIVRAELSALLSQAKAEGQAVIFQLGGSDPHALAEKIYLRPPFTDHGLSCGYMRWRPHATAPWAKELPPQDRPLIGLQMP